MFDGSQVVEALNWRYACKKFDSQRKIGSKEWGEIEQILSLSPSSYGLQPWKFVVVQDPALRRQLRTKARNQAQVEDCSHFIVFTHMYKMTEEHIKKVMVHTEKIRNLPTGTMSEYASRIKGDVVTGPRAQHADVWTSRQVYIALGNAMTACAIMDIDTCPMEGFDPEAFDQILKLNNTNYRSVVCLACGYRSSEDPYQRARKSRLPISEVIEYK